MLYYTGVGSRQTPVAVCNLFIYIGLRLEDLGYTLRSGGAPGADLAFEKMVTDKNIYLPWKGFNNSTSELYPCDDMHDAFEMAATIHPTWSKVTDAGKKLHARNCYQVLGKDLNTPSEFLLCWTDGGVVKGGTATAIKLAKRWNIPVLNFGEYKYENMSGIFEKFMFRNNLGEL